MPVQPVERKLAAIFATEIAGYSRLMARDEVGTLGRLKACRAIIDELIAAHRGRIFNTAGDSIVADFASAVDAVQCAVAVQTAIAAENAGSTLGEAMQFRVGVRVGDVMVDGENLLGDGVNIAARLEGIAEPGAICVSAAARDHIGNKLPLAFASAFIYVQEWNSGDLIVWDNRCLVHAATWFDAARYERVMWRTTVHGNPGAFYAGEHKSWIPRAQAEAAAG